MTSSLSPCSLCGVEVFVCDTVDGEPIYGHLGYTNCDDPSPNTEGTTMTTTAFTDDTVLYYVSHIVSEDGSTEVEFFHTEREGHERIDSVTDEDGFIRSDGPFRVRLHKPVYNDVPEDRLSFNDPLEDRLVTEYQSGGPSGVCLYVSRNHPEWAWSFCHACEDITPTIPGEDPICAVCFDVKEG